MEVIKKTNEITIQFTDEEIVILAGSLLDPLAHFETVAREKLANCKSRLLREWVTRLQEQKRVAAIPTDDAELLTLILNQPDYKSRTDSELSVIEGLL